jgi:replicative DNA helicase
VSEDRVPPHSHEIESAVLSAWSLVPRFGKAYRPEPDLFHVPAHRRIAAAAAKLDPENRDEASLLAQLDTDGTLQEVGGRSAVFAVLNCATETTDPWKHVARLREYKALRDTIALAQVAIAEAYQSRSLSGMVTNLQDALRASSAGMGTTVYTERDLFTMIAHDMLNKVERRRVSTGIPSLDHDIGGYFGKTVSVFGADTSWGKSSYGLFLYDVTVAAGKRALIVSHEDSRELYGRRLMARRAKIRAAALRDNRISDQGENSEWSRVLGVAEKAGRVPFFIEAIGWTVERTAQEVACVCAGEDIDLVMDDYLQAALCQKAIESRRVEMGYVMRVMTNAVKTAVSGPAGVFFSQLHRPLKPGEEPTKYSLKEAGELENGAENVLLGYFNKDGLPIVKNAKGKDGVAGKKYQMAWNDVWAGFEGEAAEGQRAPDMSTPESHRGARDYPRSSEDA